MSLLFNVLVGSFVVVEFFWLSDNEKRTSNSSLAAGESVNS